MLPHISNSEAGRNKYDPVHKSIFEVGFTIPKALDAEFGTDAVARLTEHVLSISGLENFYKGPEADAQKFMGTSRSYIKPTLGGETFAEFTIKFSLNLRKGTDNYIYKLFRAWQKLNYNIATGERELKADYTADWFHLRVGNRRGDVYHELVMKDVMMSGNVVLSPDYEYGNDDALELEVKFRTDWWDENNA